MYNCTFCQIRCLVMVGNSFHVSFSVISINYTDFKCWLQIKFKGLIGTKCVGEVVLFGVTAQRPQCKTNTECSCSPGYDDISSAPLGCVWQTYLQQLMLTLSSWSQLPSALIEGQGCLLKLMNMTGISTFSGGHVKDHLIKNCSKKIPNNIASP